MKIKKYIILFVVFAVLMSGIILFNLYEQNQLTFNKFLYHFFWRVIVAIPVIFLLALIIMWISNLLVVRRKI